MPSVKGSFCPITCNYIYITNIYSDVDTNTLVHMSLVLNYNCNIMIDGEL